jgi:hypothetical protein
VWKSSVIKCASRFVRCANSYRRCAVPAVGPGVAEGETGNRPLRYSGCPGSSAARTPTGVCAVHGVGPGVAERGDREQATAVWRLSKFVRCANSHRGVRGACCWTGRSRRRRPGTGHCGMGAVQVRPLRELPQGVRGACCWTGRSRRRRPGTGHCGMAAVQVRPLRELPQGCTVPAVGTGHRGMASVQVRPLRELPQGVRGACCWTGRSRRRRPGTGHCGMAAVQVRPLRELPQGCARCTVLDRAQPKAETGNRPPRYGNCPGSSAARTPTGVRGACCWTGRSQRRRPGTGHCGIAAVQVRPLRELPQGCARCTVLEPVARLGLARMSFTATLHPRGNNPWGFEQAPL